MFFGTERAYFKLSHYFLFEDLITFGACIPASIRADSVLCLDACVMW